MKERSWNPFQYVSKRGQRVRGTASGGSEKGMDSQYILRVEPRLPDTGCRLREKERVKDDT